MTTSYISFCSVKPYEIKHFVKCSIRKKSNYFHVYSNNSKYKKVYRSKTMKLILLYFIFSIRFYSATFYYFILFIKSMVKEQILNDIKLQWFFILFLFVLLM